MFMCVYRKSDKVIAELRNDTSIPQTITAKTYFDLYCNSNKLNSVEFDYAEMPYQEVILNIGQYIYDSATNSVKENPDWVPPPAIETSNIPVSGA